MRIELRDFDDDLSSVPRHWVGGHAAATAISNGINLLFPHGERFFVRSVKKFLDQLDDPALRADVEAFFGQEGRHAHAHDDRNAVLRTQGFEIDQFLDRYKRITDWLEARTPPKLRLAVTAASEHFTAILAEGAFRHGVLDACDPKTQRLLAWHAAEEIERKHVAFDVLQKIDPSYALRVTGMLYATLTLGGFWFAGARMLLRQEGQSLVEAIRSIREIPNRDQVIRRVFVRGIRQYLKRDFHPNQLDHRELAATWFAVRGLSLPTKDAA